jgi:diaminopimelate decarboxylase
VVALEGIGKGDAELSAAVRAVVDGSPLLWVSLESAEEARALARAATEAGLGRGAVDVLVRLNPSVQPETHEGLAVGAADSKFGVLADELPVVVEAGRGADGPLRWRGLHLHVGSQLGAVDAWRSALRLGLRVLSLQRAALPDMDTLDIGSGFPVEYGVDGSVPGPEVFAAAAMAEVEELPPAARPARLAVEPGRAIVAACGWLIARVLHVRDRSGPDGPRRLLVLDAGMTELIRPALYGAEHPMVALTSNGAPVAPGAAASRVRVDGPVCESTDQLGTADLPALARDDLVAIGVVGAYGSSMASTYNGRPRPPELAWDGSRLRVLRARGPLSSLP